MRAESRKNYYETLNKALRELYGIENGKWKIEKGQRTITAENGGGLDNGAANIGGASIGGANIGAASIAALQWDDDGFDFDDGIFEEAARELLNAGGYSPEMLADNEACRNLIKETFRVLDSGVSKGLGTKPDPDLAAALRENVFVFSGFKTHAELEQAAQLITDEKGVLKPFNQFLNDAKTINAEYNHNYLRSEYNQAVQSAQIAAKWHDVQSRKDLVNLQYRTANDERVRAEHRRLHGVTLPVDDPFWKQFTPPLGWNCRCTIVEVLKDDYPESDSQGSIATATQITDKPKDKIFRFNPGIEKAVFPKRHPYFPKGCGECGKTLLAYNPKSIWCKACGAISKLFKKECESKKEYEKAQRIAENKKEWERYKKDPDYVDVDFNPKNGGLKATHKLHNFDKVGGDYEKDVQNAGYNAGHSVVFTSERGKPDGEKYTEGLWDGLTFEIGTSCGTGSNNIKKIMQHCYKKRAQIAVINFKDASLFSMARLTDGITDYYKYNDYDFKNIIYIVEGKVYYYK